MLTVVDLDPQEGCDCMTPLEAKELYANEHGYVKCTNCPVGANKCLLVHPMGKLDCWTEIARFVTVEADKEGNPYWENICKMADKQRAKGMATYGQGIESNPMDIVGRLEYLQEELIDALMYCEWIKDKLMKGDAE
jgi:hypothetical protein